MTAERSAASWIRPHAADPATSDRPPNHLRILCLLPTLNPYGGVISVINIAERWLDQGHHVEVLCLSSRQIDVLHPRTEPFHITDRARIPEQVVGRFDVLLATSWETVEPAVALARRQPEALPVHFVQDIEWELVPSEDVERCQAARESYDRIALKVVKTAHLQRRLAEAGWEAERIVPGMNLDVFYPRDVPRRSRVLAMARPDAPDDHRGFQILSAAFSMLARERPDVEIALFGTDHLPGDLDFPCTDLGVVAPVDLPALYSSAAVYVDASRHHGFGRTGAEAMACGTPCVLSASGGIDDYAVDGRNALIVPVGDARATAAAVERLLADDDLAQRLTDEGRRTVAGFRDEVAADQMLDIFRRGLSERVPLPNAMSSGR